MNFIAIIPARYASSRFPGKPLAKIGGKPMIQLVYEQVQKAVANVYVATDDQRIFEAVQAFGGKAVMTSPKHQSGTDRCFEAYNLIQTQDLRHKTLDARAKSQDIIINVQGDEPFIQPEQIEALQACFADPTTQIATLVKPFPYNGFFDDLANQNSPKVVINKRMEAMYFSRSIIPYKRGTDRNRWLEAHTYYKHIGMYAYRAEVLQEITQLPQSPLELAESLEQLRWLENGYRIKVGITQLETIGIDTPDDLEKARVFYGR
ncbi:MAG: 3-deoxy-manno-octulosonate cytidylyltransferase [Prevotellaceae bacterium]|nr:3-deoxy-manno-octulosonate cytidylyltransferase [Prevotellaceae bacterium]